MPTRRQVRILTQAGRRYHVPPALLYGVWGAESDFGRNRNTSSAGARGPFQFMPGTAASLGIDPYNFRQAAFGAARYLAPYLHKYGRRGALVAYNAGPGRIGGPLPSETQAYIPRVLQLARGFPGGGGGIGGGGQPATGNLQSLLGGSDVSSLPGGSGGTLALLQALQGAQGASQAPSGGGGLQAPAFSAAPTLPQGAQPIASSSGPQPKQDIGALLQAVQTVGAGMPSAGVPDAASALRGGVEGAPAQVKSGAVGKLKAAAERIDDARVPYLWGGGHQGKQNRWGPVTPLDCSGAVSRALGINPLVSGQFAKWGKAGRGNRVTIYANNEHVLMEIDGRFWGTSQANPRGGAGWIPRKFISKDYLSRFAVRHPPGM